MHRILKIKQILIGSLATMATITIISIGSIQTSSAAESDNQSLQELYEIHDRIVNKLESLPTPRKTLFFSESNISYKNSSLHDLSLKSSLILIIISI